LPAAIAAPTPVRALVHRSTLVTAGVWLLLRFLYEREANGTNLILFGLLTLFIASLAAFLERDAKKVVALSTLSQLGFILFAFFMGGKEVTILHLIVHALAKANLFLLVGTILHHRFSQQRVRFFLRMDVIICTRVTASLLRLSGLGFFSGIFSKEEILKRRFSLITRVGILAVLLLTLVLTLGYCYKLLVNIIFFKKSRALQHNAAEVSEIYSPFLLGLLVISWGGLFFQNFRFCSLKRTEIRLFL
jgi:NADH:ubiquinone oxidoreductase subunit 5 (subunit L)/multisubunit Na+/H+ antiporter MnhA subunit